MQIPRNIKSRVHDFSVTAKEFYDFMPNSTKASFVVGVAAIVHSNRGMRLMRQQYTWKECFFSPRANLQFMKDHKVRTAVSISFAVLQHFLSKQSQKDLKTQSLAMKQSQEDKLKTLISEIASELKVMADEYGFELDMDKLDLTVTEDNSVEGFKLTVVHDDTEVFNGEYEAPKVQVDTDESFYDDEDELREEFETYAKELLDPFLAENVDLDQVWAMLRLYLLDSDFYDEVVRDVYYRAYNDEITVNTDAFIQSAAVVYEQQFRPSEDDEYTLIRVLVAPCGHICGIDTTDEDPGFCRTPEEAESDKERGFTQQQVPLHVARTSTECDHNPRWGIELNTEAVNDGPSFERTKA